MHNRLKGWLNASSFFYFYERGAGRETRTVRRSVKERKDSYDDNGNEKG